MQRNGHQTILVGTSRSNSYEFANINLTHRHHDNGDRTYRLHVDGRAIKQARLSVSGEFSLNAIGGAA